MGFPGQPSQFPTMYPGSYSPGRMLSNNNPELSQLISMFSGSILGGMAGPGSFVPEMNPTQMMVDQFAMKNYQQQVLSSTAHMAHEGQGDFAKVLLGMRGAMTDAPASELNKEQAMNMAGYANNPFVKPFLGAMIGPENLEAMMHGSKGDVHALSNTLNKINYFRQDPSGVGRMDSESLTAFNKGMYAHLYEPQGNVKRLEEQARSTDAAISAAGTAQLKKAARAQDFNVVSDTDAAGRLEGLEDAPKKVDALYKKYVAGGKATETKQQAQELAQYEDALNSAGVLKETETTVGGLVSRANKVPTQELGGFMAGQVGKISENMFQRGMMPMAVGNMSAADRARLINTTPLDEETETRLSREMARKDLESKTNKSDKAREFRGLETEKEREEFLSRDSNLQPYKETLAKTREKIGKAAEGPMTAESASDLEKLQGFDALSSNVDAKRSADAIKKYTGAVSAIKDIFGDNGNPNAPLPALLAALEGLTGGAIGSMKPEKIQSTLRQMQTLAKEAGVGFEQMAAMSSQIDSTGQMLGLTPADTMRLKGGALAAVKVMQDTGSFSNPIYGQSDKGTATQKAAQMMTQGAASRGARSMAAMANIFDMSEKGRFAEDSEIAQAMKAYRNNEGDGSYTFTDKDGKQVTQNIRKQVGELGERAVVDMLRRNGVTNQEYTAQRDNPLAMENAESMFGYLAQKHDILHKVNSSLSGRVASKLADTAVMQGRSPDEQKRLSLALGATVNELIFETSDQDQATQVQSIQQNLEQKFQAVFDKEHPDDPGLAKAKAKEAAAALSRPEDVNMLVGTANSTYAHLSNGGNYREAAQRLGKDRDTETARQASLATKRAAQKDAAGMGYSSSAMAEASDYFREITEKGQKFNMDDLLRRVGRVTTDRAVLGKYASGMGKSFELLSDLKKKHFVTNTDISKMDESSLRKAAGLGADIEIVSDDKIKQERDAAIADMSKNDEASKAAVLEQYKAHVKTAGNIKLEDVSYERQTGMLAELKSNPKFAEAMEKKILGEKRTSRALAEDRASQVMAGEAKDGQEAQAADVNAFERALLAGADESTLNAGVHATLRLGGIKADEEQTKRLMDAVRDTSPESKAKLKTVLDDFEAKGVIKGVDTRNFATTAFEGIQQGIPLEIAKTLGMAKFTDRELTKELTAQNKARGMHETEAAAAAKETAEKVTAQREAAEKAGGATPQTAEAERVAQQKHMEDVLQKDYVEKRGMPEDKAREQAVIDAAAITKNIGEERAAASAAGAGDARQQRVDTLEVHAQTVVIKSGKVDGESGGTKATAAAPAAGQTAEPQKANIIDKVLSGDVSGALRDIKGGDGASLMDSAFVTGLTTLEGKPPAQVKPGDEKPDVPLSQPAPAPAPSAPEPAKVAQANSEQLKHDKGVATTGPTVAAGPQQASAPKEKKTAYDLTEDDIATALGGVTAMSGSKKKEAEFLQSTGLLKHIKGIKDAQKHGTTNDQIDEDEKFEDVMSDAVASGLIPHPVDEDGDKIFDFKSDEAIAAAEKHLEKYLPADKTSAPVLQADNEQKKKYAAAVADVPLSKPAPAPAPAAPEPEKVTQANGEQLKHDKGVATTAPASTSPTTAPQEKKTAYELAGADIVTALGGADAIRGSKEKQQELLQSGGMLKSLKEIKIANERGGITLQNATRRQAAASIRDAVASGLIPHPVDKDGNKITDFESDEAIAAAEKHLEKYLPKSKEGDAKKEEKRYTADELARQHPESVENTYGEMERWQPGTSRRLPDGAYKDVRRGVYVNPKTGEELDRYGNAAGGTYSADGSSWESGSAAPPQPEQQTAAQQLAKKLAVSENKRNTIFAGANLADRAMGDYAHYDKASAAAKQKADDPNLSEADRAAAKKTYQYNEKRKDDTLERIAEIQTAQHAGMDISGGKGYSSKYSMSAGGPEGFKESFSFNGQQLDPKERNKRLADLRQKVARGESIASEKAEQLIASRDEVKQNAEAAKQAGVTKEEINSARKSAYTAPPPSMAAAVADAVAGTQVGQAVLTGATAMYEKYAPNAVKDMVSNYGTETRELNEQQYAQQESYAKNHARYVAATTEEEKKDAKQYKDNGIVVMAHHNAAREAGIDTKSGAVYDEHAGTINGRKVDKDAVKRHVRLLEEKAEKDPLSIVSDDVQKTLKIGKYSESAAVKTANDEQLKKSAGATTPADKKSGVSSANVSPEAAAKTAAEAPQSTAQSPVAAAVGNAALATAVPETEMTKPNSAPINRVHAMSANTPVGPAPVAGGGGGGMGGPGGGGNMTINGTLTLSGLQEAILNAQGSQVMQTDNGGAPIVLDPTMQQGAPAPPKTGGLC